VVDTTPKINSEKEDIMISVQSTYLCLVNDFFFLLYRKLDLIVDKSHPTTRFF
jgi:hypothetical protein